MKSSLEDDPSSETLSVVLMLNLLLPPKSRTSPESSFQQRCPALLLTNLTGSAEKVEFSNISQDLRAFDRVEHSHWSRFVEILCSDWLDQNVADAISLMP